MTRNLETDIGVYLDMPTHLGDHQNLELAIGLARGDPPEVIAQAVGCATKTVLRRMDDPDFMAQVEALSDKSFHDLPAKFRGAVLAAFDTILELSRSGRNEGTRLSAAKMVLDYAGIQPPKQDEGPPGGDDAPIYAIRDKDGIYRPIILLPSGKVEVQERAG